MSVYLNDPDVTLYHGDALDVLRQLPDESVDCVVTSPPYWGLRDYGTGEWDGGDPDCDHPTPRSRGDDIREDDKQGTSAGSRPNTQTVCKCGATRVDRQLGLEPTPDLFVANMVAVFREVRRVLADHGTCFMNLGDSYNNRNVSRRSSHQGGLGFESDDLSKSWAQLTAEGRTRLSIENGDLKEKDLVGVPWMVAFALRADGWYLRSDIIWSKPNPMPESVTDRPTKAHEYVFLLTKRPRYWFDAEAVREEYAPKTLTHRGGGKAAGKVGNQDDNGKVASGNFGDWDKPRTAFPRPVPQDETLDGSDGEAPRGPDGRRNTHVEARDGSLQHRDGERWPNPAGRNVRSVWQIATQPYPEAHFATFPEELARRCILAGCPVRVCKECRKPSERILERKGGPSTRADRQSVANANSQHGLQRGGEFQYSTAIEGSRGVSFETVGWSECDCGKAAADDWKWRPGVVLDPFIGSGTVAKVARDHQRHAIGIDLNRSYLELAARRLQQLSLLAEA